MIPNSGHIFVQHFGQIRLHVSSEVCKQVGHCNLFDGCQPNQNMVLLVQYVIMLYLINTYIGSGNIKLIHQALFCWYF